MIRYKYSRIYDLLNVLITNEDVLKIDQGSIHRIYEKWPQHFKNASSIKANLGHAPEFYSSLVLCGMGGSGTSCDILHQVMLADGAIPSVVIKGGNIPKFVNKRSLVIVNSASGNTKEAIEMMNGANSKGAEVICISSGGRLKEVAEKLNLIHIDIPFLSAPRVSLPYMIIPGLKIINPILSNPITNTLSIQEDLIKISRKISISVPYDVNVAKQIAGFLEGGFAFCFASPSLLSAGTRFKNSLNENSKLHCLKESIMEASHNEVVPFTFGNNYKSRVLLLRWIGDSLDVSNRFEKVKSLLETMTQPFIEIIAEEVTLINAIISSIYLLDYSSIYMAVSRKIDPSPTPAIDILKSI